VSEPKPLPIGAYSLDPEADQRDREERDRSIALRSRRSASAEFPLVTGHWSLAEWEGYARTAWARKLADIELSPTDIEAIERFPERPSSGLTPA
jgi:hypothetical protein